MAKFKHHPEHCPDNITGGEILEQAIQFYSERRKQYCNDRDTLNDNIDAVTDIIHGLRLDLERLTITANRVTTQDVMDMDAQQFSDFRKCLLTQKGDQND